MVRKEWGSCSSFLFLKKNNTFTGILLKLHLVALYTNKSQTTQQPMFEFNNHFYRIAIFIVLLLPHSNPNRESQRQQRTGTHEPP